MTENQTEELRKTPEVHVHLGNFFPWSAVVGNKVLIDWAKKSQADKLEWIAAPLPAYEVIIKPVSALQSIFGEKLGHGHVIFNPYATIWNVLRRQNDPLRPGENLSVYNLLLAKESVSRRALQKLEIVKGGKFPVIAYPPFNGQNIQGNYTENYLETHPVFYNDNRNAEEIIKAVKSGVYSKVCVDLYHFQEAINTGNRPFGTTEKELFQTLETFYKAGVLGEIHVQPGRLLHLDQTIETEEDLKAIFGPNPSYQTRLGRMLKFLIHDLGFMGPYTSEIDPRSLIDIYGKKILLPPGVGKILEAQGSVVDYIRRA